MFEAVNKAYEFLCSKSAKRTEGPDPVRIVLLLQSQSILFQRYADGEGERERRSIRVYFRKRDKGGNICMKTYVAVYEEGLFDLRREILGGPLLPPPPKEH